MPSRLLAAVMAVWILCTPGTPYSALPALAAADIPGVEQTLFPEKDAMIHSAAEEARGERKDLWVGMEVATQKEFRSLIQFDLAGLKKTPVRSAILRLCCTSANSGKKNIQFIRVHPVYRDWAEKTVMWRALSSTESWFSPGGDFLTKACAAVDLPQDVSGDVNRWYSFDVTTTVQQWQAGALKNHGLILMNEAGSDTYQYYASREADNNRPQLLISYTQAIVTPDLRPKDVSTLKEFGPAPQLAPKIASPGLKPAVLNQPYSFQLIAVGGERPYKWEIVGMTPAGFELSPEGLLSGTPSKAGTLTVRLKCTGSDKQSSQVSFKWEILAADPNANNPRVPGVTGGPGPSQVPATGPGTAPKPKDPAAPGQDDG